MLVKICGITTDEVAKIACEAGADLLGFVFADSSRKITPERAAAISQTLPAHVKTVGVFVNETREKIDDIAEQVGLDYIQLHGDESPEFCQQLRRPVIKAFSIKQKSDLERLNEYTCAYYLVDSPGIDYRGGSGIPFDWDLLTEAKVPHEKVILAGGLQRENVAEAIRKVRPAAVDVSSGVETNKQKDPEKIIDFIREAKKEESD
ncbi:phosphoribosylanthranilate isomerase [Bacillus sp. FJAT-50079]|uniref:phosphoribosylanthranilate isomerase n=1 Tax=Bacillus sp. FJAT-50079 TaxID=2833577 RepID=UPI0032D5A302